MNENAKTAIFVGVALLLCLVAWLGRPSLPRADVEQMQGKVLFAEFDDPLEAASLEIIEFDEDTATVRPFKVAQVNQQWCIPSHDNYPADAEKQLAEAAASLIGLKVLEVASDSPGDHALYGVLDPDPNKRQVGDTGVGTRVIIRDKKDKTLLDLIVGRKVPGQEELRYVRVAGKDPVYTVALKTDKLSTKFEDWIEADLLQLNTWDVRKVRIHDYSVDLLAGRQIPRSQMELEYDDSRSQWELTECKVFRNGRYEDALLAEDEELNTTKLNDMKWALDDLKIVDVARKPEGLSANLRDTGKVPADSEAFRSLASRGFYIVPVEDHYELLSSEGEISVLMKDGVEYILRFGNIAGGSEEAAEEETAEGEQKEQEQKEGEQTEEKQEKTGLNRYLFVMAEFNPDIIPKPELEPLPEAKPEEKEQSGNGEQAAKSEGKESGEAPEQKEPPAGEQSTAESGGQEEKEAQSSEKEKEETEKSELEKERERIKKENERKQKEYEEKIEAGKKRVKELNERFANWYYIISDEVYRKIHLSREDVVKKKEQTEEEAEETAEGEKPESEPAEQQATAAGQPKGQPAEESTQAVKPAEAEGQPAQVPAAKTESDEAAEQPSASDEKPNESQSERPAGEKQTKPAPAAADTPQ